MSIPSKEYLAIIQILNSMSNSSKIVTDKNLFALQGPAVALDYELKRFNKLVEEIGRNEEEVDIFWPIYLQKLRELSKEYETIMSNLSNSSDLGRLSTLIKSSKSILERKHAGVNSELLLAEMDENYALILKNPHNYLRKLLSDYRSELIKQKVSSIEMNSLSSELRSRSIRYQESIDDSIIPDFLSEIDSFDYDSREYFLVQPIEELVPEFLKQIQARSELSYTQILQMTDYSEATLSAILSSLEDDGRIVRDRTADQGEIIYFPEHS